jgi:hypothetical protein
MDALMAIKKSDSHDSSPEVSIRSNNEGKSSEFPSSSALHPLAQIHALSRLWAWVDRVESLSNEGNPYFLTHTP